MVSIPDERMHVFTIDDVEAAGFLVRPLSAGPLKCDKCSTNLRFIGYGEDEYGPHTQFRCDTCNPEEKKCEQAAS